MLVNCRLSGVDVCGVSGLKKWLFFKNCKGLDFEYVNITCFLGPNKLLAASMVELPIVGSLLELLLVDSLVKLGKCALLVRVFMASVVNEEFLQRIYLQRTLMSCKKTNVSTYLNSTHTTFSKPQSRLLGLNPGEILVKNTNFFTHSTCSTLSLSHFESIQIPRHPSSMPWPDILRLSYLSPYWPVTFTDC